MITSVPFCHLASRRALVPNDSRWSEIADAMNTIKAPQAWEIYHGSGGAEIAVCVISSGIDPSHPDLRANMLQTPGYDPVTGAVGEAVDVRQRPDGTHHAGTGKTQ
eukprot:356427-Chlamydomonas_euryale.AAC.6